MTRDALFTPGRLPTERGERQLWVGFVRITCWLHDLVGVLQSEIQ